LTIYVLQGSVATDLRGGDSFNSGFIRRFFLNLAVNNYENWFAFAEVLPFGARKSGNYVSPCSYFTATEHGRYYLHRSNGKLIRSFIAV